MTQPAACGIIIPSEVIMSLFIHLDMNNFYASVECQLNPSLRDKPVAVAGSPEKRHGVVLAKNEIAKKFGVKTGDTVLEAEAKAPGIVFVPPHFDIYDKISKKMFGICNRYTCFVEPFGPDECWLDCTETVHLFGSGEDIANGLRASIKEELELTASAGVSFTKMFAKLGSDIKKPDATTVITRENYKEKVWGLAVGDLCGVGNKTAEKLKRLNILTIGDLARADERVLKKLLGKPGVDLRRIARGEEEGQVREAVCSRDVKSVSHGLTALRDLVTREDGVTLIGYLSELVAARLKKYSFKASGIYLGIRYSDLTRYGKQLALPSPICSSSDISDSAIALFDEIWNGQPLRSIDVGTFALSSAAQPVQLSMFDGTSKTESREKLDEIIAGLRMRYGKNAVIRASQMNEDIYTDKDVGDFLPFKR